MKRCERPVTEWTANSTMVTDFLLRSASQRPGLQAGC